MTLSPLPIRNSTFGVRRSALLSLSLFLVSGLWALGSSAQPNIVFILADDLGWADTTLYGHTKLYETPHLERLAKRGMTFTRAYSASPLCSPTRASILTGLNPARLGLTTPNCHTGNVVLKATPGTKGPPGKKAVSPNPVSRLDTKYFTIAERLKKEGYATGHFGKWHLGKAPHSPLEHGFDVDISHSLNQRLWDDYFFSTIGNNYYGSTRSSELDRLFPVDALASGEQPLPNPRHRFVPLSSEDKISNFVRRPDGQGPRAIASRIAVEGAFNVNSSSKDAWKAVLASMADFEFPTISTDGTAPTWERTEGIRFPRFGHVLQATGWNPGSGPLDPGFWQGYRELDTKELDALAAEIVKEVRERGPFRSFADFVNRDPSSERLESQLKGPLQTALDLSVNSDLKGNVGDTASNPTGAHFSGAITNENESAGFAGYLTQGDILQSLAPILQVRSDYFRIRASGQATDASGRVLATAVCEAYVQRISDYVDPGDEPHLNADQLTSVANRTFGRRFQFVSFRWLAPGEV